MPDHEKGHLGLKFEKGKTYVFKVNMGGDASGTLRPTAGASEAEKSPADQPRQEREDGTPPAGDTPRGQPASAISSNQAIDYRIQVKEVTGDETTLLVNVDRASKPTSGAATPPRATTPGASTTEKSLGGIPYGTFTFIVDKNGHVRSGTERSEGVRRTAGDEEERKGAGREEERKGAAIGSSIDRPMDDILLSHIAIISGCGLHEKALKPGEIYSKDSAKDSEKSPASSANPSVRTASSPLASLKLRYEGPTNRGNKELARFTILADAFPTSSSATRPGSANEPRPGEAARDGKAARDEKAATERGSALGKESLGEALFSMEDGILETLRFDGSRALASMGRLTIDRQSQDDKAKLGN
ncbi:MAG TPA: hypothetical protein VMT52_10865 [Planctomycetota bacterium]|nr:hypothetical protein [Planctomycetota bacterium]